MNLGVGLTFLRQYDFTRLGFIYQAFFSLSIGLERIIKLIILYEYIYLNDSFPPKNYLKSKGHNLKQLFNEIKPLIDKYSVNEHFERLDNDSLFDSIIDNLSDFATQNRYFQLNELSGINSTVDPIKRWEEEVNSILVERHYRPNTKRKNASREIAAMMNSATLTRHHSENDRQINDFMTFTEEALKIDTKQKYGMFYVYCIIRALCELQYSQNATLYSDIFLYEFFVIFRNEDKYAKSKKTWNPHPPYKF